MENHGFRKIIFTLSHDVSSVTAARHIADKKLLASKVAKLSPRGISSCVVSNVLMTNESIYEKQISRLSVRKSQYLPLELPIFDGKDWIDASLNYLLYKQKKKPLFLSFDKNLLTYEPSFAEHLIHTRLSAFMLDMNAMTNPSMMLYLKKLIDANAIIIPGISGVLDDYSGLFDKFSYLSEAIEKNDYAKMIVNSSRGAKAIF
ncbi:MAG: hypothetical protein J6A83_03800 [Clostridia bacterium]|nr:hypothetical protein [Clostridia bacterium]